MFEMVIGQSRNYILEEDLHAFMRPKQAREAFHFLDRDKSGRLTLREVNEAVANVFQCAPCASTRPFAPVCQHASPASLTPSHISPRTPGVSP